MKITDEAVEAFRAEAKDCTGRELSAELVHRCLTRAIPHLSQGAARDATYTEMLIDNAATASQNTALVDDPVTREAIRLNIIDPLLALSSHEPAPTDTQEERFSLSVEELSDILEWALIYGADARDISAELQKRRASSPTTDPQEGVSEAGEVVAYLMEGSTATWLQSTSGLAECDKPSVTPVPLVRKSALTACQQEVERLQGMLSGTNKVITGMSRDFTSAHDAYEASILELVKALEKIADYPSSGAGACPDIARAALRKG